jgi:hypothetical protein
VSKNAHASSPTEGDTAAVQQKVKIVKNKTHKTKQKKTTTTTKENKNAQEI